jgi:hypothetical protein
MALHTAALSPADNRPHQVGRLCGLELCLLFFFFFFFFFFCFPRPSPSEASAPALPISSSHLPQAPRSPEEPQKLRQLFSSTAFGNSLSTCIGNESCFLLSIDRSRFNRDRVPKERQHIDDIHISTRTLLRLFLLALLLLPAPARQKFQSTSSC